MNEFSPDFMADLSCKVEGLIALECGMVVPYISIIFVPNKRGAIALFTNRKSNEEVEIALEEALRAVRENRDKFKAIDGRLQT